MKQARVPRFVVYDGALYIDSLVYMDIIGPTT